MDSIASPKHRHGSLPKLSTSKELSRRDSLSSSRTRDSGYNSDLDVSFSPLDYVDLDQHVLVAPLPSLPGTFVSNNKALAKTLRGFQDVSTAPRSQITSSPTVSTTAKKTPQHTKDNGLNTIPSTSAAKSFKLYSSNQDNDIEKWIKDNLPSYERPEKRVSSIISLSSASSCEMYTDSDMSDEQPEIDVEAFRHALPKSTHKVIHIIMRKFEVSLRMAAFMQCNGGSTSNASSTSGTKPQQSTRKVSQHIGKRKLGSDDNFPPNDEEEDNSHKRRCGSLVTIESSDTSTRFACPFYKHEPHRFRNRRTCPGPGWHTVHRMKEHLYRAHAQSIYCPRCYAMFDADIDLSNHLRSAQCQVSAPQPIEGIDRETLKALRKRSPAFRLEEDKWRDVYHHLFPDVALENIPSPFYNADSPTEESRRFRRSLLRRVQQELVNTATHLPGPVEQRLLQQVASIIRQCENDLLNNFDASSSTVPSLVDRRASDTSTLSTVSAQLTPRNTTPMHTYNGNSGMVAQIVVPGHGRVHAGSDVAWGDQVGHVGRTLQPPAAAWEQQPLMQDSITEWIDLDAVFPPPEDTCNEPFVDFNMPMWNR